MKSLHVNFGVERIIAIGQNAGGREASATASSFYCSLMRLASVRGLLLYSLQGLLTDRYQGNHLPVTAITSPPPSHTHKHNLLKYLIS